MQRVLIKDTFYDILKAALYAMLFSIGGILIFALAIKAWDMSDTVVTVFNMANKVIALFLAVFIGVREKSKGLLKGIIIGVLFLALTVLMFTILNRGYDTAFLSVFDIIFVLIVSIIITLARVNL